MPNSHLATTYVADVTHVCVTFHSVSLYDQSFSSYKPFWDN